MTEHMNLEPNSISTPGEHMSDNQALLDTMLQELDVHPKGEATSPGEGLIASNFFIDTVEKGPIVIRANELGEVSGVGFEVRALAFLGAQGAPVPSVIPFSDGSLEKHIDNKRVIAYKPLDGVTLSADELDDPVLAADAGELLNTIVIPAGLYEQGDDQPDGDIEFIRNITAEFLGKYPDLADHNFFKDALTRLNSEEFARSLQRSPQGIVHADFFFENIIKKDGALVGVIDFGDAYYGAIVNDIIIGAMEFSVLEDTDQWKSELFEAFLKPNAKWLVDNKIDFETFHTTLLANCLRFAVYTLGFEREENPLAPADQNRYVQRYFMFKEALSSPLLKSFEKVCSS